MERELVVRAQAGDQAARDTLVLAHAGLVSTLAHRYCSRRHPYEDLRQEGFLALLEAIPGFDTSRGKRFPTYAGQWVRSRLLEAIGWRRRWRDELPVPGAVLDERAARGDAFAELERREQAEHLMSRLSTFEAALLHARYWDGLTYERLGRQCGRTRERIRQIHREALERLRFLRTISRG